MFVLLCFLIEREAAQWPVKQLAGSILAERRLRVEANQGWHPKSKISMTFSVVHLLSLTKTKLLFINSFPAPIRVVLSAPGTAFEHLEEKLGHLHVLLSWAEYLLSCSTWEGCSLVRKFSLILWNEGLFKGPWNEFLWKFFSFALSDGQAVGALFSYLYFSNI